MPADLDARLQIKFFPVAVNFDYAFRLVSTHKEMLMIEVSEITLEKLQLFTDRSNLLVTIDAPLFGTVMVFNGRVLHRGGTYVEPEKIGNSIGFPTYEDVLAEATRFWIVDA